MAASEKRAGGEREGGGAASAAAAKTSNGRIVGPVTNLKCNSGIDLHWSREERKILKQGLAVYASEPRTERYALIAKRLPAKTARDVALRTKWMSLRLQSVEKKDSGKKRKDDHSLTKKSKDKKERVTDLSVKPSGPMAARSGLTQCAPLPMDNDDEFPYKAIGGPTGQLLEQNAYVFSQIQANFTNFRLQDNQRLFHEAQKNIVTVMLELDRTPGVMKQMPPLPVKLNVDLLRSIEALMRT